MISVVNRAIGTRLATFLSKALPGYQRFDTASLETMASVMEPGDILLVEGNTRISIAIKYLTMSSWSHACLYVGPKGADPEEPNLLEADLQEGVRLVSLSHYQEFNLRICRPVNLQQKDLARLLDFVRARLGHRYDLKNVFDLVRYLIQRPAVPTRYRRAMIAFGSGEPTRAICSTLIAEAFQSIDYPILPNRADDLGTNGEVPLYYKRHFTHFTPRDFDLSPYFRIVKPTIESGFDYRTVKWGHSGAEVSG